MMILNRLKNNGYVRVLLLSFLSASLTIVPFIITGHGLFTLVDDFNFQQIPFNMQSNMAVKSGNIFWNWNTDLGSNFIGAYSFYTLGSPFFWLSCLFPASFFPYLIGPLLIVKYCVAGVTAYGYIKRYVTDKNYAVVGALLYAFSGFSTVNLMFNHFHDVIALFPLLMIGIDRLVIDKKKGFFAIAVAINMLLNYFFFTGEVVFVVLYFIVRFLIGDFKKYIRTLPAVLIEAVIGAGMGCILFLPSVLFTMQNPRLHAYLHGADAFFYDRDRYLQLIKAFLMPADVMPDQTAITIGDWKSSSAYLPVFGLSLVFAFLMKKKKSWLSILIAVCLVLAFVPILNSLFYALNATYYARWFYMLMLLFALATALVLDRQEAFPIKTGLLLNASLLGLFVLLLLFIPGYAYHFGAVRHMQRFLIYIALAAAGLAAAYLLLVAGRNSRHTAAIAMSLVILFAVAGGIVNIHKMRTLRPGQDALSVRDRIVDAGPQVRARIPDMNYRTQTQGIAANLSMTGSFPSVSAFTSTVNGSIFTFYRSIGIERKVFSILPPSHYGLLPYLSVKYRLSPAALPGRKALSRFTAGNRTVYVYAYPQTLPIGFTYDHFITEKQLARVPIRQRHLILLKAVVVPSAAPIRGAAAMTPLADTALKTASARQFAGDMAARKKEASYRFRRDNSGFTAELNAGAGGKLAFFSVPFDSGWTATVNGKTAKIIESNGFMAVPVTRGTNHIAFRYMTPGLKTGATISAIAFAVFIIYLWAARRRKPRGA